MKAVMAVHILVSPKLLNTSFICMVFFYYDAKSRHHCPQIYSPVYMAFCCTFFLSKGVSRLTICFAFYRLVYMLAFYRLYIYIYVLQHGKSPSASALAGALFGRTGFAAARGSGFTARGSGFTGNS